MTKPQLLEIAEGLDIKGLTSKSLKADIVSNIMGAV